MKINSLNEAIDLSLIKKPTGQRGEIGANFTINIENDIWQVYCAYISYRDILLLCDKGTATFLVDSYGDNNFIELFNWEYDYETN